MSSRALCLSALLLATWAPAAAAFCIGPCLAGKRRRHQHEIHRRPNPHRLPSSSSALNVLLDVPEGFFTVTFPMLGILLGLSKSFSRAKLEERAWEQRLDESRRQRLQDDPSLTESDIRRLEAELEWSAYGKPRIEEEERREKLQQELRQGNDPRRSVNVVDDSRQYRMSDDEIEAFETEYAIDYDPYYDDPYTEDELPSDEAFSIDKQYGDRIYESGEIFYKDGESGLYYRQGAKPRNLRFWN